MTYQQDTITTIHYNYDDLLSWIQANAAKQLGLSHTEIGEQMVKITPDDIKELDITVTFRKSNTNIK